MSDKILIGRCQTKETQYGELLTIAFGPSDIEKINTIASDGKGWINLTLKRSQKNNSPYLEVYLPKETEKSSRKTDDGVERLSYSQVVKEETDAALAGDDLPF